MYKYIYILPDHLPDHLLASAVRMPRFMKAHEVTNEVKGMKTIEVMSLEKTDEVTRESLFSVCPDS